MHFPELHCIVFNHISLCCNCMHGLIFWRIACYALCCVVIHSIIRWLSGVTLSFGGRCETGWREGCTHWTGKRVFFLERRHLIENRLIRESDQALVCRVTTINRLSYAGPAWLVLPLQMTKPECSNSLAGFIGRDSFWKQKQTLVQ